MLLLSLFWTKKKRRGLVVDSKAFLKSLFFFFSFDDVTI